MPSTVIRLEEPGRFTSRVESLSAPRQGEARVRIRRIGVCGTDIHAFHGRQPFFEYPRILGHELAAEVIEVHGDSSWLPGDLVAVEPYLYDPDSPASRKGKSNCCEALQVLGVHCDGGMRKELNIPVEKLHRSGGATADQLALVEMLGIGCHAVNRSSAQSRDRVLLLGAGPIGLSVLSFLQQQTDSIVVADLDEARLSFCREAFGIEETVTLKPDGSATERLSGHFGEERPDLIFDATGNPQSMHSTFELIAHGGRIVFVGLFQGEVSFPDPMFHRKEISLLASRNATSKEFGEVIAAMESGAIDTSPWITHRFALDQVLQSFPKTIADRGLRKAVIEVDD
ncbi:MAG: zinc-binding alcohol dehydrogenase family protein [Verrucomicrobiota bacterium]